MSASIECWHAERPPPSKKVAAPRQLSPAFPLTVPRVRDVRAGIKLPLATYLPLQTLRAQDVGLFRRVLANASSTREHEPAAETVPDAFGIAKSSVSVRFIRASAEELRDFHTRRHEDREWLVLLLDGKTFAAAHVVIALGVTTDGEKRVLGLAQTATENKRTCAAYVRELIGTGLHRAEGLLVVLDGAKGIARGGARCVRRRRRRAALSVAQTRKRPPLSPEVEACGVAAQTPGRVRRCRACAATSRHCTENPTCRSLVHQRSEPTVVCRAT